MIVAAIPESSWDTRYIHSVGHESIPSTASSKLISGSKASLVAAPIAMALAIRQGDRPTIVVIGGAAIAPRNVNGHKAQRRGEDQFEC